MDTRKIGIIGAGVMGSDIALHVSQFGYDIVVKDVDEEALNKARKKISTDARMLRMMSPRGPEANHVDVMERIDFTLCYDSLSDADIVIENVSEKWEVKKVIYRDLEKVCKQEAILFANTSCISITKIASLAPDPQRVIGVHFMNPVPRIEMVEVIKGYRTSDDTMVKTNDFLRSIKKKPVVVGDSPGFVANRLSHLFMNEAAFLVLEQVASPKDVDMVFKKGYGHAMGPLETADLIGLDTVVDSLEILYTEFQDPKFRCCPILKKMVAAGLLGRKSGEGFYKY